MRSIITYLRSKPLRIVFTILWSIFVFLIIFSGSEPSPHSFDIYYDNPPEPYQTGLVLLLVTAMALHLALLAISDVLIRGNWKFFVMLLITILFLLYFGRFAMHAQPSLVLMIMWTLLSFLIFLLLYFWQACLFLLKRFFRRS